MPMAHTVLWPCAMVHAWQRHFQSFHVPALSGALLARIPGTATSPRSGSVQHTPSRRARGARRTLVLASLGESPSLVASLGSISSGSRRSPLRAGITTTRAPFDRACCAAASDHSSIYRLRPHAQMLIVELCSVRARASDRQRHSKKDGYNDRCETRGTS